MFEDEFFFVWLVMWFSYYGKYVEENEDDDDDVKDLVCD